MKCKEMEKEVDKCPLQFICSVKSNNQPKDDTFMM